MNDVTFDRLVQIEEEHVKNVASLDDLLDTEEKQKSMLTLEKAQKLEHEERKLRLEESKQKLEAEKIEYQKKKDKKDNIVKIVIGSVTAAGGILAGVAKLIQIHVSRKAIKEAYAIDEVTTLTSKTARDLLSGMTNPKI